MRNVPYFALLCKSNSKLFLNIEFPITILYSIYSLEEKTLNAHISVTVRATQLKFGVVIRTSILRKKWFWRARLIS